MSHGILFLPSQIGHLNGCTDLRIILMFILPSYSLDMFVSACYFWPPGFISLAYGVFPPRCDWSNLMTYEYCQPKILTYLSFPFIRSFFLLLSVVLNSSLRCRKQGSRKRVWFPVKKVIRIPPPRKDVQTNNLCTILERPTLSCRVTWAWSWSERVNMHSRQIMILPRNTKSDAAYSGPGLSSGPLVPGISSGFLLVLSILTVLTRF
jgi:hypothetical protein